MKNRPRFSRGFVPLPRTKTFTSLNTASFFCCCCGSFFMYFSFLPRVQKHACEIHSLLSTVDLIFCDRRAAASDVKVSQPVVQIWGLVMDWSDSVCVCVTHRSPPPPPPPRHPGKWKYQQVKSRQHVGLELIQHLICCWELIFGIVFLEVKRCLNLFKVSASSSHSCINSDCVLTFVSLADRVWHLFYKKTISSGSSVRHSRSVWNRHERLWGSVHSVTHDLQMNQRHPVPENRTATGRKSGFGHCDVWLTEELWNPTETDRREREREWLTVYTVGVQGRASSRRDQKKENI